MLTNLLKSIKTYNISNRGRDKGSITSNVQSNKRKATTQVKKSNVTKSTVKCRCANSKKKTKTIITISDSDDNCNDNNKENLNLKFNELEYRERKLALKEREILLRERKAKVCVMELSNLEESGS
ncbi:hypothetical protein C1646_762831 [Rhizophagus diaphanus]|nr:hypothetical protein C1646_762831 [Rhizophagus diaphanus] [Rhizophagus sp. MUCL 43196]